MKMRLSTQGSLLKFGDMYKSMENQKTLEKMLEDSQKENRGMNNMNFYGKKSMEMGKGIDQNESMDNQYY